jgi:hypothetical protein
MSDTPNQPLAGPSSVAFEEFGRQIGTQAALVAGFAFAGLTVISYDPSTPRTYLVSAFSIACAATIALELLALVGSGKLTIMEKRYRFGERLNRDHMAAAYLNLAGLVAFVIAVNFLVWIKFRPVSWIVTIIFGLMLLGGVIWDFRLERLERITKKYGHPDLGPDN